jgi:hypothetical protein
LTADLSGLANVGSSVALVESEQAAPAFPRPCHAVRRCERGRRDNMRGPTSRPWPVTLFAALAASVVLVPGCSVAVKTLGEIVLKIGTEVVVQVGADYIKKIFSSDDEKDHPTLIVSYINAAGDGIGTNYAIASAKKITTDNVSIRDVKGDIHIVADRNGIAVTVGDGTTATIEIHSTDDGGGGQAANGADDQAATIDGILGWSGRSRSALFDALDDLGACRNIGGATSALRNVAADRAHQIDALDTIDVSALPSGGSVRGTLLRALSFSLKADQAFVRWGGAQRSGCHEDENHREALSYSRSATSTKKQFVSRWNPIARTYGLPEYREPEI